MANWDYVISPYNWTDVWGLAVDPEDSLVAYETAHDLSEATDKGATNKSVGQSLWDLPGGWNATVYRLGVYFNTGSGISDSTVILALKLRLGLTRVGAAYTGLLYIKMGSGANDIPRGALTSYPLYLSHGTVYASQAVGELTDYPETDTYEYDISSAIPCIKKGGWGLTTIVFVTQQDADRVVPDEETRAEVFINLCQLVVTVTLSVTTDPATNVEPFTATLNGTLTQGTPGGGQWDCYFEWGSESPYDHTTTPVSIASGETFLANLTGLYPGTTYRFRAVAEHATLDTMYGSWRTFNSGGGTYPEAEALARVSSLIHRWVPGSYTLEMVLGGLTSEYSLMVPSGKPTPTIPPTVPEIPTCPPGYMLSWTLARGYHCIRAPGFPEPGLLT